MRNSARLLLFVACRRPLWLLVLGLSAASLCFGQNVKEIRKTAPLGADGAVSIETFKGTVTVTAWDKPQVEIYARVEPDGTSAYDAEKVQNTEVRIEPSAGAVRIKSDYDKLTHHGVGFIGDFNEDGNLPFVNYTISMPRGSRLDIQDHKSTTTVSGLKSDVKINTHKGSVVVSGLEGSLDLETHKGDVKVEFAGLLRESRFSTHKGDIEIVVPRSTGFNLDSDFGRGAGLDSSIDLSSLSQSNNGLSRSKRSREQKYVGPVNGGGPLLRISTFKGHIRLRQS
jgi:hypothetical protein